MATQFFLRGVLLFDNTIDTTTPETFNDLDGLSLLTTRGAAAATGGRVSTPAGPTAGLICGATPSLLNAIAWLSFRVNAFTLSGSITANLRMSENAMANNIGAQLVVERRDLNGAIISVVANSEKGTELGTNEAAQNWAITPTSTAFADGDRISISVCFNDAGGTMAAGATCNLWWDGPTSGASGDSYVTFTETITEFVAADRVPRFSPYPQLLAH